MDRVNYGDEMHDLYNGNIGQMVTSLNNMDEEGMGILANQYRYDQLQRIKEMDVYEGAGIRTNNSVESANASKILGNYRTRYSFDGNGNLLTLSRNNDAGELMDDLSYSYNYNPAGVTTNQLTQVEDDGGSAYSTVDLETQLAGNYVYDAIGQLIHDRSNDIEEIEWTVTGKVRRITYDNSLNGDLETNIEFVEFEYNAMGERVSKKVFVPISIPPVGSPGDPGYEPGYSTYATTTTYYMHDASGNVLATYTYEDNLLEESKTIHLDEHHIYGSKRLGLVNQHLNMDVATEYTAPTSKQRILGEKSYELANHLGNVLVVVSDRLLSVQSGSSTTVDYYEADVTSYSEYYPYGSLLPGRHGSSENYRYGFQGQEMDDEIKGEGNSVNYKYRMHDPRIGRFFAVDPLAPEYPHYSPYSFSGNKVVAYVELEGLEEQWAGFLGVNIDQPLPKKTMWYSIHRMMAAGNPNKSFWKASVENTKQNNAHYYPLVRHVNAYYEWAEAYTSSKGMDVKWISSAKTVTGKYEVGLIEYDPLIIPGLSVSKETKAFIIGTGQYLLKNFTMPLMKEFIENGTIKGYKKGSEELDYTLLRDEQIVLQYRLEIFQAQNPQIFEKIMGEYNEGFALFMGISGDTHYLVLAAKILGRDLQFENLQDRLVMGLVLHYQGYGKEIDDNAQKEILKKSLEMEKSYVPILPPQN